MSASTFAGPLAARSLPRVGYWSATASTCDTVRTACNSVVMMLGKQVASDLGAIAGTDAAACVAGVAFDGCGDFIEFFVDYSE